MNTVRRSGKPTTRGAAGRSADGNSKRVVQRRAGLVVVKSEAGVIYGWSEPNQSLKLFRAGIVDRVNIVKSGVPAQYVEVLTGRMGKPKDWFYKTVGLMRATVDRKVRLSKSLNQDESERVVGMARLIGQAQNLVEQSGRPAGFDAARWIAAWLDRPLPALGRRCPREFMDTADGRSLVADLLAQQQSGAYA